MATMSTTDATRTVPIPDLAALALQGADAAAFLQGYATTDTQLDDTLAGTTAHARLTAFCNVKGRVVANGWIATRSPDDVQMYLPATMVDPLTTFLRPYLMFSKCSMEAGSSTVFAARAPDTGTPIDAPEGLSFHIDVAPGTQAIGPDEWRALLVAARIALITERTTGRFLPQMLGLDDLGAIDFDKGCYLGQEVVARAKHRGEVKRRLARFAWLGTEPKPGDELFSGDSPAGTVIAAACETEKDYDSETERPATVPQRGTLLAVVATRLNAVELTTEGGSSLTRDDDSSSEIR